MNDLQVPSLDLNTAQQAGIGLLSGGFFIYFLIFIGIIILFLIIFAVLKNYLKNIARFSTAFDKVVLLITVPKESSGDDNKQQKQIKDLLSPMEGFFANIGGLKAQHGLKVNFLGRNDHISFEIVINKDGVIRFYVVMPKSLRQFVEQQIHAQHPAAQIETVEDYNLFDSKSQIESAYLKLRNKWAFPIKTYQQLENDPLNGILTSLSKIPQGSSAAIQIVARSANAEWHRVGAKIATEMQQGKKLSEVMSKKKGGVWKFVKSFYATDNKKDQLKDINKPHQLSPMEQEIIKGLEAKSSKAGLDINIRIVVASQDKNAAKMSLQNILNSFAQYTGYEYGNGFKAVPTSASANVVRNFIYRDFIPSTGFVLNTEELTSLFHFPLSITEVPNIQWLLAKKAPAPVNIPTEGIILGKNIYRGEEKIIRIKRDDRRRHVYLIGKTGVGKSVLISNMAIQDIENGEGVCVIDPNGDLVENILANVPKERAEDVIYFNPANIDRPMGLNLLEYD
ncbi:MAG: type IV secretion system DNA-binding domain-containing protein, partial [Patescibacteria group bacterium]|nr:type IV secretion system DNA-binding domain-containing protein [Patescibacteria group bacterium]